MDPKIHLAYPIVNETHILATIPRPDHTRIQFLKPSKDAADSILDSNGRMMAFRE